VGRLAARLGWPVLADALSPVRQHASLVPGLVTAYDAILRNPLAAARLRPASVLCLDSWPTSKALRKWITEADPRIVMLGGRPDNRDALHGRTEWIDAGRASSASARTGAAAEGWNEAWAGCERRARAVIDGRLEAESALFEPKAAWLLARLLPPGTPLFIANSMPVRDAECVWPAGDRALRPCFNRGANGIDGTLSTALGFAHGGPPAVLLTGDLALLHDTNGFLASARLRGGLTIVLINNGGGGIFAHLPVAREKDAFEQFFATPQRVDFARLTSAYGVAHEVVADWVRFADLIGSLPADGVRLLEVRTDRRTDPAGRRRLFEEAARAAGEGLSR
jgi:2-succinyl-5-enolpyruvyl-6-hydroxy-3-cyclohexene-1-carboxylate synthase